MNLPYNVNPLGNTCALLIASTPVPNPPAEVEANLVFSDTRAERLVSAKNEIATNTFPAGAVTAPVVSQKEDPSCPKAVSACLTCDA